MTERSIFFEGSITFFEFAALLLLYLQFTSHISVLKKSVSGENYVKIGFSCSHQT